MVLFSAEQKRSYQDTPVCLEITGLKKKRKKENLFDTCEHLSGNKKPPVLEVIVLHTCWQRPWLHFFFFFEGGQIFLTYFLVPAEPRRNKATDSVWKWLQQRDYRCDSRLPVVKSMQSPTSGVWRGRGTESAEGNYKCNRSYSHQSYRLQSSKELIYLLQLNWAESFRISSAGSQACGVFFRDFSFAVSDANWWTSFDSFSMREQTVTVGFQLKETLWSQWNSHSDKRTARKGRM